MKKLLIATLALVPMLSQAQTFYYGESAVLTGKLLKIKSQHFNPEFAKEIQIAVSLDQQVEVDGDAGLVKTKLIQIVGGNSQVYSSLFKNEGKAVKVKCAELFRAETAHHTTKVLCYLDSVQYVSNTVPTANTTTAKSGLSLYKTDDEFKYYKGQVTLTGTYTRSYKPNDEFDDSDNICFTPDTTTAKLIPRPNGDTRKPYFCFSNFETARKQLNLNAQLPRGYCSQKGKATVTIQGYDLFYAEVGFHDLSKLISAKNVVAGQVGKCRN